MASSRSPPAIATYGGIAFASNGATAIPSSELPSEFAIDRVWPSPSRGPIHVAFSLPRAGSVRLSVLDLQGREVAALADGTMSAGRHQRLWNARSRGGDAPAGIYFLRMVADGRTWVRRLVLAR